MSSIPRADGQRPLPQGRWPLLLLGRRPADPGPGRLPVRRRRDPGDHRPRPCRTAAHPGSPAAHADHAQLEDVALEYAADIARQSPQAIRMLKFAFNLADDGLAGQQVFAGEATRLAYMTDEAVEGKEAFLQKRDPDWSRFPHYF